MVKTRRKKLLSVLLTMAMVVSLLPALSLPARAASTYTVTSASDAGPGSLRDAMTQASASSDSTITFDPSLAGAIITLASGALPALISSSGSTTLVGLTDSNGNPNITINGNGNSGISAVGSGTLSISNVVFTNFTLNNGLDGYGAAITTGGNYGTINLYNCVFSGNTDTAPCRGAIVQLAALADPYAITIDRCIYKNNTLTSTDTSNCPMSAALAVSGHATITNSLFSGNSHTASYSNKADGCAIIVSKDGNYNVNVWSNTFYGNSITNSGSGGAEGTVVSHESTVSGTLSFYNNIMLDNTASGNTGETRDVYSSAAPISQGNNVSTGIASDIFTDAANGDFALKSMASSAIDQGNNTKSSGSLDLAGKARISGTTIDIGAYELVKTVPTVTTDTISTYTATTATMGGNVTASGGEAVTESGVVYSTTDNSPTIAEGATKVSIGTGTGTFSQPVTGLAPSTTYYVCAYATNSVGTSYGSIVCFTTPDTYTISTLTNQTMTTLTGGYSSGTQETKTITVTRTGTGTLPGLTVALSGAGTSSFEITQPPVTTLDSVTTSTTFTIKAKDGLAAGSYTAIVTVSATNMTDVTFTVTQVVNSAYSGGGSTTDTGATVIVNGETRTAATAQTTTDASGQTTTTVTVDTGKLQTILDSQGSGATVIIPISGNSNVAAGVLTGAMVKSMETKDATLVVQTASGTYKLPASEINIDAMSRQFGTNVTLPDIKVTVSISEPSASMTKVIENAAQNGGFTIMVPAVDYTISCTYGSQTVGVSSFNAYVERTIAIPAGVDPAKITTGVVVDPDGTTHPVPTRVTVIDGKYYAVINSLTNSTYSVVSNPIEFSDVSNHWAKNAINDMGSRMVVTGAGNNNFAPDRNMTRAEFATIMVRALGLEPGTGASGFGDVSAADWYCGFIKTAASYGIIKGYDNGSFKPNAPITREEAMTMLAKAMTITKLSAGLTSSEINQLLSAFSDGKSASSYAKGSIAACLKTGISTGTSGVTISPKANITRAEVAVMVQRLLQKSKLI